MSKYLGPYETIKPDGDSGKEYHIGDNVPGAASRIAALRQSEGYRFEDDPVPAPATPVAPPVSPAANPTP